MRRVSGEEAQQDQLCGTQRQDFMIAECVAAGCECRA